MAGIDPGAMYVCIESFAGQEDRCARGVRLLGSNVVVQRYANFYAPADTPDDVIFSLRARMWEPASGVVP
jgi:hypothetical protein